MGKYKVDDYFYKQFGSLMEESRERKAFDLGYARGLFELYKHIAEENDFDYADKMFKFIEKENKQLRTYIEMYKEEDSETERYLMRK